MVRPHWVIALYCVKAILVLDQEGGRLCARYFTDDWGPLDKQLAFEKQLHKKAQPHAQIIALDNNVIVYKNSGDVAFYVVGDSDENELLLESVLSTLTEAISFLLRADESTWNQVDRRTLAENLDYLYLVVDELVDGGIVLESDPKAIADRVAMRDTAAEASGGSGGPISEQTIAKAFSVAKDIFMG
ncbi:clathrin adaptor complex small chain subfamily protein [Acanthamoeba castellanii str. Neff]|uniref:Zeta-coat protein n=1 Tax=Acanthamoeba castellanii (strain ATCC 30010 / Neff) TaxID=1257118 RepID=L8GIC8_ACACF|nr:clathrin adaptor complex small chain subfamily protein [Acanthamoeba castellanii str. Neff]ELR12508.1 clathrin adaptor complex small chain subfamily protein [Acanthamoeba castellanii str. Neff]